MNFDHFSSDGEEVEEGNDEVASPGTIDAGKKELAAPCLLCKRVFKDRTVLRAHVIEEHGVEVASWIQTLQGRDSDQPELTGRDVSGATVALFSPLDRKEKDRIDRPGVGSKEKTNQGEAKTPNTMTVGYDSTFDLRRYPLYDDEALSSLDSMKFGWPADTMDEMVEFIVRHEHPWNSFTMADEIRKEETFQDAEQIGRAHV